MKKLILFTFLFLIYTSVFSQTIVKDDLEQSRGETRTKANYHLYEKKKNLKLSCKLDVRKSGMSGNGKGSFAIVILDENFQPIFEIKKGLTVGSRVPQGTNSKDWIKSVTITGELAKRIKEKGVIIAFNANTEYDDKGILTSLNDFKKSLKDLVSFAKEFSEIAVGESFNSGDWKITKIN